MQIDLEKVLTSFTFRTSVSLVGYYGGCRLCKTMIVSRGKFGYHNKSVPHKKKMYEYLDEAYPGVVEANAEKLSKWFVWNHKK